MPYLNNCTITNINQAYNINSTVESHNVTLQVTPDDGYVVTAANFTVPVLTSGITLASIANTTTAGVVGNKVNAVLTVASFNTGVVNKVLPVRVVGDAKLAPVRVGVTVRHQTVSGVGVVDAAGAGWTMSRSESNQVQSFSKTTVAAGEREHFITKTFTAQSGKYLEEIPNYVINSNFKEIYTVDRTEMVFNSDDYKTLKEVTFKIYIRSTVGIRKALSESIIFTTPNVLTQVVKIPSTKQITGIKFGSQFIGRAGEQRKITVSGHVGAIFTLTLKKVSNNANILSVVPCELDVYGNSDYSKPQVAAVTALTNIVIPANKSGESGLSSISYFQDFPATTGETFRLDVNTGTSTAFASSIASQGTYDIKQLARVTASLTAVVPAGKTYSTPSSPTISIVGEPKSEPYDNREAKELSTEIISKTFSWVITKSSGTFALKTVSLGEGESATNTIANNKKIAYRSGAGNSTVYGLNFDQDSQTDSAFTDSVESEVKGQYDVNVIISGVGTTQVTLTGTFQVQQFPETGQAMSVNLDNIFS